MTTQQMMDIALRLSGLSVMPEDCSILNPSDDVRRVLAGIDMSGPELVAAKMMSYDCVARHHPQGPGNLNLGILEARYHREIMIEAGVPLNIAQKIADPRKGKMERGMHGYNALTSVQLARLLGVASLCVHTPADLLVERELRARFATLSENNPRATLQDIVDTLLSIREFAESPQKPEIFVGDKESFAGRIFVTMAGGGACTLEEHKAMIDAGVGTFVVMHMSSDVVEGLKTDGRCNVVCSAHMASDSYGFNRVLDAWQAAGLEVTRIGGII
jgi:hypothetical protein